MKQFFCDCCGKQTNESDLDSLYVNGYEVDLCSKCHEILGDKIDLERRKAEVKFMQTMKHQPLGFKYHCG